MTRLADHLARLEEALVAQNAPILGLLRPGLSQDQAIAKLVAYMGSAPDELVLWYCWRDGLRPGVKAPWQHRCLLTCWTPLALDDAIATSAREKDETWWEPGLLVIVRDASDWVHRLTTTPQSDEAVAITYWPADDPPRRLAGTLTDVVAGWVEAFDRGLFWDIAAESWRLPEPAAQFQKLHDEVGLW